MKTKLLTLLFASALPALAGHMYWLGNQSFFSWPNAVATLSFAPTLNGTWYYSNSLTFCAHGSVATTNRLSTNSPLASFCKIVVTNKNGIAGTFATNVTAFYRRTVPTGFTAFSVPFDPVDYSIGNVCQTFPTNTAVVFTDTGNSSFTTNWFDGSTWTDTNAKLYPGYGYFVLNTNAEFIAEFYGWSWLTTNSVSLSGSGTYKFRASKMPIAGYMQDLGFDNDQSDSVSVHLWSGTQWIEVGWTEEDGWDQPTGLNVDPVKGPYVEIGQAVMIEKHGSDSPTWIQPGAQ